MPEIDRPEHTRAAESDTGAVAAPSVSTHAATTTPPSKTLPSETLPASPLTTKSTDVLASMMGEPTPDPALGLEQTLQVTETPAEQIGHYQLLDELGRGGMGVVYTALDTKLERKVAIKLLASDERTSHAKRLVREALAMAKLSHPNVIPVYEIGERGDSTFVVMEFVEGVTLRKWLEVPRTQAEILATFKAAARGLSAAHQKHLVHRDFKPDNVMVGVDGRVRVMDFGLARANTVASATDDALDELDVEGATQADEGGMQAPDWEELTRAGSILGTPAYMSPEQLSAKPAGPASDQFSFCVALYEALYGARPFSGETLTELCARVVMGELDEPPEGAQAPEWLGEIVRRGLRPQPEERFASMEALLDALIEGELAAQTDEREPPEYVFIAHDNRDKQAVLRMCEGLLDHGVRPWLDMWELTPGKPWRRRLEEALAAAPAVLVCGRVEEYADALSDRIERDPATVYVALLEGVGELGMSDMHAIVSLDLFRWEERVADLARIVGVDRERDKWLEREAQRVGMDVEVLSPYRGLEAFREQHARWMFGREEEVAELLELIASGRSRFLTLIGASGSGKSSLLLGGVCPMLRNGALGDGRDWSIAQLRPGARPCEALAHALVNLEPSGDAAGDGLKVEGLRAELLDASDTLRLVLSRRKAGRLLVVIDQLEELFTEAGLGGDGDAVEAMAFVENLLEATQELRGIDGRLWIAATLRADFMQRGLEVSELAQALKAGTYCALPPMREGQIRAAVERPAARVGYRVEAGLVDELVRAAAHHAGRLPLLQHVLRELWARRDNERRVLTLAAYRETGGLEGAIAGAAERALDGVRGELGDAGVLATRRLMTRLVHLGNRTSEDTRRRVALAELGDDVTLRRVLRAFVQEARVLVAAEVDGVEAVEIAHEALLREWSTLVAWLDADREALKLRQELAVDAEKHEEAQTGEHLWGRGRVEEARRVLGASVVELNEEERGFLEASERSVRRRRRVVQSVVAGLLTAAALIIVGFRFQNERIEDEKATAQKEKAAAQKEKAAAVQARALADAELTKQKGLRASMLAKSPGNELMALGLAVEAAGTYDFEAAALPEPVFSGLVGAVTAVEAGLPLMGHEDWVEAVSYTPDHEHIVTGSLDRSVRVWDANTGALVLTIEGHEEAVHDLVVSPDGSRVATASDDKTARVWVLSSGEEVASFMHEQSVNALAFSPDGKELVTGTQDGAVTVWAVASAGEGEGEGEGAIPRLSVAHEGPVRGVVVSPRGEWLATASDDGTARLWAVDSGELIRTLDGHTSKVFSLATSRDGARLATGSADGTARVWDAATGDVLAVLEHGESVQAVAFSPDGQRLATGTWDDDAAHLWDIGAKRRVTSFRHRGPVLGVAFSADGHLLASVSGDGTGRSWSLDAPQGLMALEGHEDRVDAVTLSLDGSKIATASGDNTARLWDARTGEGLLVLRGHALEVVGVEFSSDGERLVTASWDASARVWDATTGALVVALEGHEGRVLAASISSDGRRVVTASEDGTARMWDADTGEQLHTLTHPGPVAEAMLSPAGELILTVGKDGAARMWDAATGRAREDLRYEGLVTAAAFSPDGGQLALATKGHVVELWTPSSNEVSKQLLGHAGRVTTLAFSADGSRLVSGSEDGTARVWTLAAKDELVVSLPHAGTVLDVDVSADGQRVVTANAELVARSWLLEGRTWFDWGCAALAGRDTHSESSGELCPAALRVARATPAQPPATEVVADERRWQTLTEHGVEFVLIPAGTFMMGSPEGTGSGDEHPQNEVTLDAFYLATTEVTYAQYALYLDANPEARRPGGWDGVRYGQLHRPITGVSWDEAKAYCDWAGFELPTEAQWEYAARARTQSEYWYGDELSDLARFGWFKDNSGGRVHSVGKKDRNAFGLYDMTGNIFEWTFDAYERNYETAARVGDGLRHQPVDDAVRVVRGGSWNNRETFARSGFRIGDVPGYRVADLGFRPRRAVP